MILAALLAAVVAFPSPSGAGAGQPYLAARADGTLLMSWIESGALRFASMKNGRWSAPRVVVKRDELMVSGADFPSIAEDARGVLYAQWLEKHGHGYDVWVSASSDGGATWRKPVLVNRDAKEAEHGFASFAPMSQGGMAMVWLDGREGTQTQLRYAELDASATVKNERVLDGRVCDCCSTAMTMTAKGALVAYRDRLDGEIRDISYVRRDGAKWSAPRRVHEDDWKIAGCPVNGPQVDARGSRAAMAWFTAANAKDPRVYVAFSTDAGSTFGKAIRVDAGHALGRVDTLLLKDGSALVTWIEADRILARRVRANGSVEAPQELARVTSARAAGVPRIALVGNTAYVAWTDPATKTIKLIAY
ncbi:MAG: glycoside hydrolase [Acidobacteriota bacterium]|nr:glycoside hydrolase [Acidobacteriota bacterium]